MISHQCYTSQSLVHRARLHCFFVDDVPSTDYADALPKLARFSCIAKSLRPQNFYADPSPISIVSFSVQMVLKEALTHSRLLPRTNDRSTRAYLTVGSTMRIMFRLVFSVIRLQFHFMNVKHLSIHGARLIHHMAGPLLDAHFAVSACTHNQHAPLAIISA